MYFWRQTDKQTNKQTDKQMDNPNALSRKLVIASGCLININKLIGNIKRAVARVWFFNDQLYVSDVRTMRHGAFVICRTT